MTILHPSLFEGLEEDTKICGICNEEKPLGAFGFDGGSNYRRYECKACAKKQAKIVSDLKKTAPPVPKNHKCPICSRTEEEIRAKNPKKKGIWCADHNHETGKFRGWLCHKCNLGIGNLGDDPDRCRAAAAYIESTNGT